MVEIISWNQNHAVLEPDEISTAMDDVDLQLVLRNHSRSFVSQEDIVVIIFMLKPVQPPTIGTVGATSIHAQCRVEPTVRPPATA
jgi:hypothetical protein